MIPVNPNDAMKSVETASRLPSEWKMGIAIYIGLAAYITLVGVTLGLDLNLILIWAVCLPSAPSMFIGWLCHKFKAADFRTGLVDSVDRLRRKWWSFKEKRNPAQISNDESQIEKEIEDLFDNLEVAVGLKIHTTNDKAESKREEKF